MKLRFIGEDGFRGLKHGDIYYCTIRTSSIDDFIWVTWSDGICPYATISNFMMDWKDV